MLTHMMPDLYLVAGVASQTPTPRQNLDHDDDDSDQNDDEETKDMQTPRAMVNVRMPELDDLHRTPA